MSQQHAGRTNTKAVKLRTRLVAKIVLTLLVTLPLASCHLAAYIWVIPGSTADNLVFGMSGDRSGNEKGEINSIYVYRCEDIHNRGSEGFYPGPSYAVWSAGTPSDAKGPYTNRITYGRVEAGLMTSSGPEPLSAPGCYTVLAYGRYSELRPATVGFRVEKNGEVVQMSEADYEKLFSDSK